MTCLFLGHFIFSRATPKSAKIRKQKLILLWIQNYRVRLYWMELRPHRYTLPVNQIQGAGFPLMMTPVDADHLQWEASPLGPQLTQFLHSER